MSSAHPASAPPGDHHHALPPQTGPISPEDEIAALLDSPGTLPMRPLPPLPTLPPALSRLSAVAALLGVTLVLSGLSIIWFLRLGTDAAIYVSGFGATGRDTATLFNAGLCLIGAGGVAISLGSLRLRGSVPQRLLRDFFLSLTLAALCFSAASRITCSLGCPIPFTPQAVWQDAVHVALACVGFALALLAILLSRGMGDSPRALVLPTVLGVAFPAVTGGILSLLGASPLIGGWLELIATTVALIWLIYWGIWLCRDHPHRARDRSPGAPG